MIGPLKRAHLAARSLADEALRRYGLTMAQYTVLRHLADSPDSSGAELARLVRVTPATMAGLLAGLEADGRIERTPDPAGGRCVLTRNTAAANELLEKVWPTIQWIDGQLLDGVAPEDREVFLRVLDSIVERHAELIAPRRLGPTPDEDKELALTR